MKVEKHNYSTGDHVVLLAKVNPVRADVSIRQRVLVRVLSITNVH